MKRRTLALLPLALVALALPAAAHDFKAGDLRIDHPYATPSRPGVTTGSVYFRGIRNTGSTPDRLLSASTPAAASVEIHRMQMVKGGQGEVMQMRAVPALEIAPGATVVMKHGTPDGHHLMLIGLKAPLKDGDRFPVTLRFEKAGTHDVNVWVQTPRDAGREHGHGAHAGTDVQQITDAMKRQFDRPEAPLGVAPVVVLGDAAVAGWSQQGKGGRALLRKDKAGWSIHVCAGKGLTQADVLEMSGLPKPQAVEMARAVATAEAGLTAAQRALFDSFEGVLKVGGEGAAAHGHGPHAAPAAPAHKH